MHGDLDAAVAGQSITLTLADELDCSRGDLIAAADAPPEIADQFEATIVWMGEEPLLPGRSYWLKIGAPTLIASVNELNHEVNDNPLERRAANTLSLTGIRAPTIPPHPPRPPPPHPNH